MDRVAVNYRLWEFYYSMLEFALSWNPLQLMADKAYVYSSSEDGAYNTTNTSLLEPSLLEELYGNEATRVQSPTSDGSCANAAFNNNTKMLLEPCGLRAAGMFNDRFKLIDFDLKENGNNALHADSTSRMLHSVRKQKLQLNARQLSLSSTEQNVSLNEAGIAWATDGDVFVNSPAVQSGQFAPGVAYLHHQQPHIVTHEEGMENEHFRVWMHTEAFPAFNKRYGFIDRDLVNGSILIFEVEAHFPTLQFGGAKYLQLSSVDPLQVKNKFTPFVLLGFAGVSGLMVFMMIIRRLACARPAGQARFNNDWYQNALAEISKRHALKKSGTLKKVGTGSFEANKEDKNSHKKRLSNENNRQSIANKSSHNDDKAAKNDDINFVKNDLNKDAKTCNSNPINKTDEENRTNGVASMDVVSVLDKDTLKRAASSEEAEVMRTSKQETPMTCADTCV
jgi:hypothetical protein